MDQLKAKRERKGELLTEANKLFELAAGEKRDLKPEELARHNAIKAELESINEQVRALEDAEKLKAEKALLDSETRSFQKQAEEETAKVGKSNKESKEARNKYVLDLFQASTLRSERKRDEAVNNLIEGGHYKDIMGEQRNFSTLMDEKGGIFLPSSVSAEIYDIQKEYGAIPRLARNFGVIGMGEQTIPNVLSKPSFTAVGEGKAISGTGMTFGGLKLKASKWGAVIDWTTEVGEMAPFIMNEVMRNIAEALSKVKDEVFIIGDGTSTYNNIKGVTGLLAASASYVRQATAASGNTSFATLDASDFLKPVYEVSPGQRSGGVFLMHPNMEQYIRLLQDGSGRYLYEWNSAERKGTLWGYPVYFSEAYPFADGTHEEVCDFFNPSYVAYADGKALTVTELMEATITNENGTSVNLATQDAKALRFVSRFDLQLAKVTSTVGATTYGAFSRLRTNNA